MTKLNTNSKKGFTIIEVVLVLAIAGLIFLMVFVALPALQRSQRDTQRRDDMARLITAVQNYQSNNKNKIPTSNGDHFEEGTDNSHKFYRGYLTHGEDDTFADPSTGGNYVFVPGTCQSGDGNCNNASEDSALGEITYYLNATCDGANPMFSQGNNKVAFTIKLEGAGTYCSNN